MSDQNPVHKRPPITFQSKSITRPNQIILSVTLTTDTLFTFDFKAHEAFDYAPNERLIYKYPDLIHYVIDPHDTDWFIQQRILSPIHRNSQILLLTIEEVNRIAHTDILKNQIYPKPIELLGFKIPEFMLQKMRKYINDKFDRAKAFGHTTIQPKVSLSTLLSAAAAKPTTIKTIQTMNPILVMNFANFISFHFVFTCCITMTFTISLRFFTETAADNRAIIVIGNFIDASKSAANNGIACQYQRKWIKNGDHNKRIHYIRRGHRQFTSHRTKLIKFIACDTIGTTIQFSHRKNTQFNCLE